MKRTPNYSILTLLLLAILGTGCAGDTDVPSVEGTDITVHIGFTRSTEEVEDSGYTNYLIPPGQPNVVFWKTGNAFDISLSTTHKHGEYTIPNYVPSTGVEYDSYPQPFDVPFTLQYPDDGTRITAVGYAPSTLILNEDNATLTVPNNDLTGSDTPETNYWVGRVDILASNTLTGSKYFNFTGQLDFIHTQSRVIFKAIKNRSMNQYVNQVRVRIPYNGQLVEKLGWNNGQYQAIPFSTTYYAGVDATPENHYRGYYYFGQLSHSGENSSQLVNAIHEPPGITPQGDPVAENYRDLGVAYLTPGLRSLKCTVSGNVFSSNEDDEDENPVSMHKQYEVTIPFIDAHGNTITLGAGESYILTFVFRDDGFGVSAMFPQWEPGGNIPVIIPIGSGGNN